MFLEATVEKRPVWVPLKLTRPGTVAKATTCGLDAPHPAPKRQGRDKDAKSLAPSEVMEISPQLCGKKKNEKVIFLQYHYNR